MLMAAAVTGGGVHLAGITLDQLPHGLVTTLKDVGIGLQQTAHGMFAGPARALTAVQAATAPHPGLPTDTQPQLTALLTQAQGNSRIDERIYPRRDTHVPQLRRFGAQVYSTGSTIHVRGPMRLHGADVQAEDIRAVTALVIAAPAAPEPSTIRGMYHLRRGHGRLPANLVTLGTEVFTDQEV